MIGSESQPMELTLPALGVAVGVLDGRVANLETKDGALAARVRELESEVERLKRDRRDLELRIVETARNVLNAYIRAHR